MNMTLYGICFKLRGGPDLLDYVQSGKPLPVNVMGQVMEQMNAVTPAEMAFAERLQADWIKAMNEKVPLLMSASTDGSYDITCTVPDEMLETVKLLTGKEYEQIVGDYTASYLKDVCGINADIVSVDVDNTEEAVIRERHVTPAATEPAVGFDLSALEEVPEGPAFEDLTDIDVEHDIDTETAPAKEAPAAVKETPAMEEVPAADPEPEEDFPEEYPEEYPEEGYDEQGYDEQGYDEQGYEDEMTAEEEIPAEEPAEEDAAEEEPAEEEPAEEDNGVQAAVAGIYKEMVTNIRDRKLDERLGLRIGQ